MKKYRVYFELYGKKLVTEVSALSEERAKQIIKDKIVFHKVEDLSNPPTDPFGDDVDFLKDMFGFK